jgi:hypothetical protein
MRLTRCIITRTTANIGYAFVEGWQVVSDQYVELKAPTHPVVVGTPEYILAILDCAVRRYPTIRKLFVGDRPIDDRRDDPANALRLLVSGRLDEVVVWLLPAPK